MRDLMMDLGHNWVGWLWLGLGISISPHEFLGGLIIALGVASLLSGRRVEGRQLFVSLLSACILAILVSIVWGAAEIHWPPQIGMAAAGVLGRPIAGLLVKFQDRVEYRATELSDRVIDHVAGKSGSDKTGPR